MWILALSLAALYALICLVFAVRQNALIFVPGSAPATAPDAAGLAYREITIATPDGERLAAWLISARPLADEESRSNRTVILYSHGNAGSIEQRIPVAAVLARFGSDVLLYDYRGFGASSGRPSEAGLGLDAVAAWELLVRDLGYAPARIVLFGESLGGAVSIELATRRAARALIVEETFTSIPAIGARLYPWLPVHLIARTRFDSLAKIGSIGIPVMILHSPDDELVPFEHGLELFAAAREPKEMLSTAGRHNAGGFRLRPEWVARVAEFALRAGEDGERLDPAHSGDAREDRARDGGR